MVKKKKLKVAITGNIGSGKTTFTKYLSEEGYPVILADDLSKQILEKDPNVRKEIIKEFGELAFKENQINKEFLVGEIFTDEKKLKKINSILHPRVRKRIETLSVDYFKASDIVFVEAALIFESKIEKMYDYVVLISTNKDVRVHRTLVTNKFSKAEFFKRDDNQLPEEVKKKKADFVFTNEGSLDELRLKAKFLISLLESILK